MRISGLNVKRIKRMFGVDVPERYQDEPAKAIQYIGGYCMQDAGARGWVAANGEVHSESIPEPLRQIFLEFGDVRNHSTFANPEARFYLEGFIVAGGSTGIGGTTKFVKNIAPEHEPDLVELHERMARNPSFIPHNAWPGREDNKWTNSDRRYHFH